MVSLSWRRSLDPAEATAVLDLLAAAEAVDGTGGVSEDVRLTLRPDQPLPSGGHLLAHPDGGTGAAAAGPGRAPVVGYAHLGGADRSRQAELVVHPDHRRRGIGTRMVQALVEATAAGAATGAPAEGGRGDETLLNIWAHGDLPAAAALAARTGFRRSRVLLQLRLPHEVELPDPQLPPGVTVRTFQVGRDEHAWLALNAAAFAHHPEQGRWTIDDLRAREEEPWFDPAGFFLAERGGRLVGFHWTKVHPHDPTPPGGPQAAAGAPPIGEVYVIGVAPGEGGAGLGRALTLIGLHHLRSVGAGSGMTAVLLYVDEDNERAVRLYEGLGFRRYFADVSYSRAVPAAGRADGWAHAG